MLKKRFGQNLLINKDIIENIVKSAEIKKNDIVIEIGAGSGNLTKELVKYAGKVFAFEIDRDFFLTLNNLKKENPNLEIIHADFLKFNLAEFLIYSRDRSRPVPTKCVLIGNIPYNITTPIITKVFGVGARHGVPLQYFSKIIFMTQLEYARRLTAKPGSKEYGSITVFINYYADVKIIKKVSRHNFKPVPKVDSAVIKITPFPMPKHECNEELLFKIVRAAFSQRRKKTINSLIKSKIFTVVGACHGAPLQTAFQKSGINPNLRAEDLSVEDYVKLCDEISLTF